MTTQTIIKKDGKNQLSIEKKRDIRGFVYEVTNCQTRDLVGNVSEKKFNAIIKNAKLDPTIEIIEYKR